LAVTNLGYLRAGGRSLNLPVTYLSRSFRCRACIGLSITLLGRCRGYSWLSITVLSRPTSTSSARARDDCNDDCLARSASGCVVEVVEGARQALVKDSRATKSERTVVAGRPASVIDRTSLGWRAVKLELMIGNDPTNASLGVGEDTTLQSSNKTSTRAGSLTLPRVSLVAI
jgi:hypothetical protein